MCYPMWINDESGGLHSVTGRHFIYRKQNTLGRLLFICVSVNIMSPYVRVNLSRREKYDHSLQYVGEIHSNARCVPTGPLPV